MIVKVYIAADGRSQRSVVVKFMSMVHLRLHGFMPGLDVRVVGDPPWPVGALADPASLQ